MGPWRHRRGARSRHATARGGRPPAPRRGAGAPANGWRRLPPGRLVRWTTPWVGRRHRHHHRGGHHLVRRLKHLRRNPDNRVLGGVCGALSESFGVDVTWVRIGVVVLSLFTGVAVLPYALAWLLIPMRGEDTSIFHRAVNDRGGIRLLIALVPRAHRRADRRELPAPRLPRAHRLAHRPGRRHRRADLAQRRRVRTHLPPRRHRPPRRPGHRGARPARRRHPCRVRRARRPGRCGAPRHGPPLHHGGHPAPGRRGRARHGGGGRSSSARGGSAWYATSSPSARPAPWPRSGRRWRPTCTTRCSRRWR